MVLLLQKKYNNAERRFVFSETVFSGAFYRCNVNNLQSVPDVYKHGRYHSSVQNEHTKGKLVCVILCISVKSATTDCEYVKYSIQ